jgi:oligopeptide transport system permease protein
MLELNRNEFFIKGPDLAKSELIARPNITYFQDAWRRLKQNKVAIVSLIVLIVIILMCIFQPFFSKFNMNDQNYSELELAPSLKHIFGTDKLGRDLFVRVCIGGRVSLLIGFVGTAIELIIGCIYGGICGYLGGKADMIMMRFIEIISSIPYILVVILLLLVLTPGIPTLIISLCITGLVGIARIIRGQVMQLKQSEYIMAAVALGANTPRVLFKHLIPNTVGIIIVYMSMDIPAFIFEEAFLSFLSLGVQPPNTSWGVLVFEGQGSMSRHPHEFLIPAIAICLTFVAFNLLGDGLRDALDPRLRQ